MPNPPPKLSDALRSIEQRHGAGIGFADRQLLLVAAAELDRIGADAGTVRAKIAIAISSDSLAEVNEALEWLTNWATNMRAP
jgi:hypothetical protein